jgi:hypothetical protein
MSSLLRTGKGSADFQVCCIADFQVGRLPNYSGHVVFGGPPAGLETCDTADLEVCATSSGFRASGFEFQALHLL